jgi:hypothetical protein
LYALHLDYIAHAGNVTIRQVRNEIDINDIFQANKVYIQRRWSDYLSARRVLGNPPDGVAIRNLG